MSWWLGALVPLAVAGWMGWLVARLRIAVVDGPSMAPTLRDRDRVLVLRTRPPNVHRGDVVVVAQRTRSGSRWIVKRVAALPGDPAPAGLPGPRVPPGMLVLLGDNPQWSVDSRDFGYVPVERVFGVAVRRLP
jgi:signal peptidase I